MEANFGQPLKDPTEDEAIEMGNATNFVEEYAIIAPEDYPKLPKNVCVIGDDIVDFNSMGLGYKEQRTMESLFTSFEATKDGSITQTSYVGSKLSPDAQPFVSKIYSNDQFNQPTQTCSDQTFSLQEETSCDSEIYAGDLPRDQSVNPFETNQYSLLQTETISEDNMEFHNKSAEEFEAELQEDEAAAELIGADETQEFYSGNDETQDISSGTVETQDISSETVETQEFRSGEIKTDLFIDDDLQRRNDAGQNVVFNADVMIPEVKLVYTENAEISEDALIDAAENVDTSSEDESKQQEIVSSIIEAEDYQLVTPSAPQAELSSPYADMGIEQALAVERQEAISPTADYHLEKPTVVYSESDFLDPYGDDDQNEESFHTSPFQVVRDAMEEFHDEQPQEAVSVTSNGHDYLQESLLSSADNQEALSPVVESEPDHREAVPLVDVSATAYEADSQEEMSHEEVSCTAESEPDVAEVENFEYELVAEQQPESLVEPSRFEEDEVQAHEIASPTFINKSEEVEIELPSLEPNLSVSPSQLAETEVAETNEYDEQQHIVEESVKSPETEVEPDTEPMTSPLEPTVEPFEERPPVPEAIPAAVTAAIAMDVEDDESEDGEGWKFYPTEAKTTTEVAANGVEKLQEVETVVVAPAEIPTEQVQQPAVETEIISLAPLVAVVEPAPVVAAPAVVEPPKSAAKPAAKSPAKVKSATSKTLSATTKSSTTAVAKDVKKPLSAPKLTTKPSTAAAKPKPSADGAAKASETVKAKATLTTTTTAKVAPIRKPLPKMTSTATAKPTTNGAANGHAVKETSTAKPLTKTSETVTKTSTIVKKAPAAKPTTAPLKKPLATKTTTTATKVVSTSVSAPSATKSDLKQTKEAMNKNLSGSRVTTSRTTTTATAKVSTKLETNVASKVSSTSTATSTRTTRLVNGSEKKETTLSATKKTLTSTTVGALKSTPTTTRSPIASSSKLISKTPPAARSSPKATSPTTPKSKALSTPKTPTSVGKTNKLTSTPSKPVNLAIKRTPKSNVEKGTIDAQSKEEIKLKNGNCSEVEANGGEPKIELELSNGFGKLNNGQHEAVGDFHITSANGSIIHTETMLQTQSDLFLN